MPAPLDRLFGGSPVRVVTFDDAGAVDGTIPGSRIAGLTMHRGRRAATERVTPGTFGMTLDSLAVDAGADLDVALRVRVELDTTVLNAALAAKGAAAIEADAVPRFVGTITDLGDVQVDPRANSLRVPVTGASIAARLFSFQLESPDWPAAIGTISDGYALWRSAFVAATYDAGLRIDPYTVINDWIALMLAKATRYSVDVTGWPNPTSVADLYGLISDSGRGEYVDRRDGRPDMVRPLDRRGTVAIPIDVSQIVAPLGLVRRLGDLLNKVKVNYFGPPAAASTREWTASENRFGQVDGQVDTNLATATEAADLADDLLAAFAFPRWQLSQLVVDLGKLFDRAGPGDLTLVRALLRAEIGSLLDLTGTMPTNSPIAGGLYWIVGVDEAITRTSWRMTLAVQPYSFLAPTSRWTDVAVDLRWTDVPPDVSWRFFGAYSPA